MASFTPHDSIAPGMASPAQPNGLFRVVEVISLLVVGAVAIYFRVHSLHNVPGLNGDEAWYGNFVLDFFHQSPEFFTPNGNPVNPFFIIPTMLLHLFFSPSIVLLRVTSLVSGLAALAVNYWFARRMYDRRTAQITTLLLAVLPMTIAYSRFGWDCSQLPLATTLFVYSVIACLRWPTENRVRLVWGLLVVLLVIHPTTIFLGPLAAIATLRVLRNDLPRRLKFAAIWIQTSQGVITMVSCCGLASLLIHDWRHGQLIPFTSAERLLNSLKLFGDLFSGKTIYFFISGAEGNELVWIVMRCLVLIVCGFVFRAGLKSQNEEERLLAVSLLVSLSAFFVVGGPKALSPNFERYSMFLIAPLVMFVGRRIAVQTWLRQKYVLPTLLMFGALQLYQFQMYYFQHLQRTGGTAAATFQTGTAEPKKQAATYLLALANSESPITIIIQDFHCYQSLRYLTYFDPNVQVLFLSTQEEFADSLVESSLDSDSEQTWIVSFSRDLGTMRKSLNSNQIAIGTGTDFNNFANQPVVSVRKLERL